jgi:hypothetical protein
VYGLGCKPESKRQSKIKFVSVRSLCLEKPILRRDMSQKFTFSLMEGKNLVRSSSTRPSRSQFACSRSPSARSCELTCLPAEAVVRPPNGCYKELHSAARRIVLRARCPPASGTSGARRLSGGRTVRAGALGDTSSGAQRQARGTATRAGARGRAALCKCTLLLEIDTVQEEMQLLFTSYIVEFVILLAAILQGS